VRGGTGQALRIAAAHMIPTNNLAVPEVRERWENFADGRVVLNGGGAAMSAEDLLRRWALRVLTTRERDPLLWVTLDYIERVEIRHEVGYRLSEYTDEAPHTDAYAILRDTLPSQREQWLRSVEPDEMVGFLQEVLDVAT
jgi:hypothetical protein